MSNNRSFNESLGLLGGIALACGSIIWGLYSNLKMNKVANNLKMSVDELANGIDPSKVTDAMMAHAVDKAVSNEFGPRIEKAASKCVKDISDDIKAKVTRCVNEAHDDVHDEVKEALMRKVDDVDISKIRSEVIREAKDKAAQKFDDDLNGVLASYNDELSKVSRIYGSIADTLSGAGRANPFR